MAIGRCVGKNYGYVGCSIDVLNYMDTVCSGKRVCKMNIPDENLRARKPCPKDFTSYFEAAYKCVKGQYLSQVIDLLRVTCPLSVSLITGWLLGLQNCPHQEAKGVGPE
jgi:hypothetical protein